MEPRHIPEQPRPDPVKRDRDDERPEPDPDGPAVDREQRIDERAEEEARKESGLSAARQQLDRETEQELHEGVRYEDLHSTRHGHADL